LPPGHGKELPLVPGRWRTIPRQEERMSVTSVLPILPSSYGPLSGNNSQGAKFTAPPEALQGKTTAKAAGYAGTRDGSQFQSALEEALRADGASAGRSTSGTSGSDGSRSSSGIALYKVISRIGESDPSTSALRKSWNRIMHSGQDADDAGATPAEDFLQNEAPTFESGSIDLTA
jgi:hypothetical protein